MIIDLSAIRNVDLSYVKEYFPKKFEEHQINVESALNTGNENGEHYKLLEYFSSLFVDEIILDLGTRDGLSALVLAKNGKNRVISYDLNDKTEEILILESKLKNIQFKKMNVFDEDYEIFKKSKFIFLDLDPHDGVQENRFMGILEDIGWDGILIADDIEWFPQMKFWFNNINKVKYNLTNWGHGSGTGLIDFSGKLKINGINN